MPPFREAVFLLLRLLPSSLCSLPSLQRSFFLRVSPARFWNLNRRWILGLLETGLAKCAQRTAYTVLPGSQARPSPALTRLFQSVLSSKGQPLPGILLSPRAGADLSTSPPVSVARHIGSVTVDLFNQKPLSFLETLQHAINLSAWEEEPGSTWYKC